MQGDADSTSPGYSVQHVAACACNKRVLRAISKTISFCAGIPTVAVYSVADRHAAHVRLAQEAFCIGPAPAKESYLRKDRVLEVRSKASYIDAFAVQLDLGSICTGVHLSFGVHLHLGCVCPWGTLALDVHVDLGDIGTWGTSWTWGTFGLGGGGVVCT